MFVMTVTRNNRKQKRNGQSMSSQMDKPTYYKALWHNCNKCRIHYMSEAPHLKAYLCDECWNSMPHYKTKHIQRPKKGPTYTGPELREIALYTIGNLICIGIVVYYLWFR